MLSPPSAIFSNSVITTTVRYFTRHIVVRVQYGRGVLGRDAVLKIIEASSCAGFSLSPLAITLYHFYDLHVAVSLLVLATIK